MVKKLSLIGGIILFYAVLVLGVLLLNKRFEYLNYINNVNNTDTTYLAMNK